MAIDTTEHQAVAEELRIPIVTDVDIVIARQQGRALAERLNFAPGDLAIIATVISELAKNILQFAARGEIVLQLVDAPRQGIVVIAHDDGPGIQDPALALQDGYSTGGGLGMGLPGAKRLADEFELVTAVDHGTTVTLKKWVP